MSELKSARKDSFIKTTTCNCLADKSLQVVKQFLGRK